MLDTLREFVHRVTGADDRPIPYRPTPAHDDSDVDALARVHDPNDPRTHDWRTLYDDRVERSDGLAAGWTCSECDGPAEPREPLGPVIDGRELGDAEPLADDRPYWPDDRD